jgi:hypothetical protein
MSIKRISGSGINSSKSNKLWDQASLFPVTGNLLFHFDANQNSGSSSTWTDLSGTGRNMTLSNCSYTSLNGGGIVFNGSNAWGTFTTGSVPTGTYTYEFLFRYTGNNPSDLDGNLIAFTDSSGLHGSFAEIAGSATGTPSADKIRFVHRYPYGSGTNNDLTDGPALIAGNYYHITLTHDGSFHRIWLNGSLVGSQATIASALNPGPSNVSIGRLSTAAATRYFLGTHHVIRGYSVALTSDQILQNFNSVRRRVGL